MRERWCVGGTHGTHRASFWATSDSYSCFWGDSTPPMGGWDGAIWDDLSSWACPFPVGDMDWPLSNWGYGLAPFQLGYGPAPFLHLLCPSSPSVMRFRATRYILGLRLPAKVVGLLHDGHVELEYDQSGVQSGVQAVNH